MESQVVVRPTPERMAQGGVVVPEEDRMGRPKPWYTFESIHDGLLANGMISRQAWEGANEFKKAWMAAAGPGCKAASMDTRVDGGRRREEMSDSEDYANRDLHRWTKYLAPEIYRCLKTVIGTGHAPTTWAAADKWHPAAARQFICTALEQFALVKGLGR